MRCLCCNREIVNPSEYEESVQWHENCIKKFFGTSRLPELEVGEKKIEELANSAVNKGLTVPGVQKKLSLHLENEDKFYKLTIVDYPTGYILKPQSTEYKHLPEAEFLSMKMAEVAGIPTVPNALMHIDDEYVYITKRIDREKGKMLAMEDFCQLSGRLTADKYKSSYENCGRVVSRFSRNIGIDMTELFYRIVFCFVTGNSDMHLKNFSLIENTPGSRVFGLSRAYDMLPVNIIMPADKEQMALTVNGKKKNIRKKDFMALADNFSISGKVAERLIEKNIKLSGQFEELIREAYLPDDMKNDLVDLVNKRVAVL